MNYAQERAYLEIAPQPLADAAALMLDTGLRVGEARLLEWRDVHFEPYDDKRRSSPGALDTHVLKPPERISPYV